CRGTRSTSGPPMPRRGCPSTAPRTGCARFTATNPGTPTCAPEHSTTPAPPPPSKAPAGPLGPGSPGGKAEPAREVPSSPGCDHAAGRRHAVAAGRGLVLADGVGHRLAGQGGVGLVKG